MAHWAEVTPQNIVTRVVVTDNNDSNGDQGFKWLVDRCLASPGNIWVQTSYDANFRKNFAGVGFTWDRERDAFIPPKPFNEWILDEETCQWVPPIPFPTTSEPHYWDDETCSWIIGEQAPND